MTRPAFRETKADRANRSIHPLPPPAPTPNTPIRSYPGWRVKHACEILGVPFSDFLRSYSKHLGLHKEEEPITELDDTPLSKEEEQAIVDFLTHKSLRALAEQLRCKISEVDRYCTRYLVNMFGTQTEASS